MSAFIVAQNSKESKGVKGDVMVPTSEVPVQHRDDRKELLNLCSFLLLLVRHLFLVAMHLLLVASCS